MTVGFRYRKLGYIALNVTDLARSAAFATEVFGLDESGIGPNGERFFRCGMEHHSMVLYKADQAAFVRGSWELETEEDLDRAFFHYQRLGLDPRKLSNEESSVLGLGVGAAFRVREPTIGLCFEYYSHMVRYSRPRTNTLTSFEHIGHYGIGVQDVPASVRFAVESMGFIPSDYVGKTSILVSLMRAHPNPNHHSFAYLPSRGKPTLNHLAFMVTSIDDIGKLFNRIERHNVPRAWGIGRHPTSGSIHLYINDPDGIVWEYTLGMEQFPEVGYRPPRFMSAAPEDSDLWGAEQKPGMMSNIGVVLEGTPNSARDVPALAIA